MKLSSPPTRHAFTSVIAAAMKYGPTRISRIAYELDMPVETCRYYLKRFHNAGFRFLPVVDYRALGLQPCVLFIRFNKKLEHMKRENFLRWFDTVYTVYRAGLGTEHDYYLETVPPQGDVKTLEKMMEMLVDVGLLENFNLSEVFDGYYRPEWVKLYDFARGCWSEAIELDIPKIPLTHVDGVSDFDKTDLLIISYLEENPAVKMIDISQKLSISPQLISYHREKHIEGGRLVTGYIPTRSSKHDDTRIQVIVRRPQEGMHEFTHHFHRLSRTDNWDIIRIHIPTDTTLNLEDAVLFSVNPLGILSFTIPVEHYTDENWARVGTFVESLEKIIKIV